MKGKGGVWVSCGGKGVTKMDQGRGRGGRRKRKKGGRAGLFCALLGSCHLPPLGCSVPGSHLSTQPRSSLLGQSCTPGRYPTDKGQRLYSTHPSDLSEHGSCHLDRRATDSTSPLPPESPPWPSSQGLQTLRTLAYDTDSLPVTSSVLNQFLMP